MEEMLDNFSNNYSPGRVFVKEEPRIEINNYPARPSLVRSLLNNKFVWFCIILYVIMFFGAILAEKNKFFSKLVPMMKGEIFLSDDRIITSIGDKFPIMINKNDPRIREELSYKDTITSLFDAAALNLCMTGESVAEVGAHYGYNSIMLGQILKTNGKYVAIEANPGVAKCLRKNIVLNDLSETVEIIEKAASDRPGRGVIQDIVSLLADKNKVVTKRINVECDTLNEMLKDKDVSLILIGVPNAAFAVLKGADKIIDESDNIRILAHLDMDRVDKSIDVRGDLTFLANHGLKFYEVISAESISEISIDEMINKQEFVVLMRKDK
ncbi:MAG: FkbM family methyltransferase [Alphaproteobacteria bacterium]|nr:FkbM family methyltransferase [Alphaproteobacteria bacterium]MBO7642070.1 FkbM family methyltransferase [Alphaproteobacteria bacterium]